MQPLNFAPTMIHLFTNPYFLFLLGLCFSHFTESPTIEHTAATQTFHTLCQIAPNPKGMQPVKLEANRNDPTIRDTALNGKPYDWVHYSYAQPELSLSIFYAKDYESIRFLVGGHELEAKGHTYKRLYEQSHFDNLYHFAFQNFLVSSKTDTFLVCRAHPTNNDIAYLHPITFIIRLPNPQHKTPHLFQIGTFGYCDNWVGDFDGDGNLDVILTRLDSIYDPPLDYYEPKGEVSASVFSLVGDEWVSMENGGGTLEAKLSIREEGISVISGNWF